MARGAVILGAATMSGAVTWVCPNPAVHGLLRVAETKIAVRSWNSERLSYNGAKRLVCTIAHAPLRSGSHVIASVSVSMS